MEAILNCSIDRTRNFVHSALGADDDFAAGEVVVLGANLIGFLAEACAGATVRAASIAANTVPKADRGTLIFEAEDVTMPKLAGVDAIAAGTKVWFSVDDNALITALSQVDAAGECLVCGTTIELSNDVDDTVRITFDGRQTAVETGTG
jgi:hypothetical protein